MKSIFFFVSVVAVLSSACGGEFYGGRLDESSVASGVNSRSSRQAEVVVTRSGGTLRLEGWSKDINASLDGASFNIEPGGEILGGSGTLVGERLRFTAWITTQPAGLGTVSFDGVLGAQVDPSSMSDSVQSPVGHVAAIEELVTQHDAAIARR
ncbi:MAG: hypothetical protein QM817_03730 [Archangium sp.]